MAFLTIATTEVPVRVEAVEHETHRFGDQTEAYDGTALTRRRAHKREWRCQTPWLSSSQATTLLAVLEGTPPLAVTGDLTGTINALVTVTGGQTRTAAGGERLRTIMFTIREV